MATYYCDTWGAWATTTSTTSTTITAASTAWYQWTESTSGTASSDVWIIWASIDSSTGTYGLLGEPYVDQRTPEQQAADEARITAERERIRAAAAEAESARATARDKARALLQSMLTVQQREQLQREMFFEIVSQSQQRYRIRQGTHGNVRLLNAAGTEVASYCGQPCGVPDEDAMLAQKLQLEYDEPGFLRAANRRAM
jgi:hypothetical protein